MDKKDALKMLGVRENAGEEEIKKRYHILLKKYKSLQAEDSENMPDAINMNKLSEAYALLMGFEPTKQGSGPDSTKLSQTEKKIENFFYYYKFHVLFGILALVVVSYIIYSIVSRVEPDVRVAIVGDFNQFAQKEIESHLREEFKEFKEVNVQIITLSEKGNTPQDHNMSMKAFTELAVGGNDVLIMDQVNFEKYSKDGVFLSLDTLIGQLGDGLTEKTYALLAKSDKEPHIYGIDVSGQPILKNLNLKGKAMIIGMRDSAPHYDNGVKVLKLFVKKSW
ncbi:MAG: hypothetical protein N2645_21390 [Clostridia bacterium]|nr:hypothetical protein [Clostridia bacterium]